MYRICLVVLSCFVMSACSLFSDKSTQYHNVEKGERVKIPEGLYGDRIRPLFPIPDIENQRSLPVEFEVPLPPDATAAIIVDPYRIETSQDEIWLQLFESPSETWPLLELYWQQYSLDLVRKEASKGFMATVQLSNASANNAKLVAELSEQFEGINLTDGMSFQIKVVHGVRRNTSEVQVRVLQADQEPTEMPIWVTKSSEAELENAVLEHIGNFVTSGAVASRHSFLANEIGGGSRIRLMDEQEAGQVLELRLSLPRARTELRQALEAAGVIVAQDDLENDKIYVSYLDADELESWYHTSSAVERRSKQKNIVVSLSESESGVVLVRADRNHEDVDSGLPRALLTIIFEHIS